MKKAYNQIQIQPDQNRKRFLVYLVTNMKTLALYIALMICSFVSACDVQSGITKKSVEKYAPTPTPERTVEVVEKIEPADFVNVDTTAQGPQLSINKTTNKTTVDCNKYNKVVVNGNAQEISIKGVCKQLMINGDKNQIVAVAFSEIVLNGFENNVQYSKYANGKKPLITDNGKENTILKANPPSKP